MIAINHPRSFSTPLHSIIGCALLLGSAALAEADVTLKGVVGARTIDDDVVIARNTTCMLNGTIIKGNVRVLSGAKLVTNRAKIDGNVQAFDANKVELQESTRVNGDVQAEKGSGRLQATNNIIGGNLQFVENKRGPYVIKNNRIDGDLQFFKNRGAGTITGNRVDGNLQSKENSPRPTVSGNTVEGDTELE